MRTVIKIRKMQLADAVTVTRLHRNTIRKINSKDYPKNVVKVWSGRNTVSWLRENFATEQRYVAVIKPVTDLVRGVKIKGWKMRKSLNQ